MKITVSIVTHKRAWALPFSLGSLISQTRRPDEVLIVLKPSGDGSEEVIKKFQEELPVTVIPQERGNVTDAYELAIRHASGDFILFIDDDAIAHEDWIGRYLLFFEKYPEAGGASGLTFKALKTASGVEKTSELFYNVENVNKGPHRKPLEEFNEYCGWISKSGFMGSRLCNGKAVKNVLLGGVNMGFRMEAIMDCPLSGAYRRSRRGFWFESYLGFCARKRGYHLYNILSPEIAPIVWHIAHSESLTRRPGFWSEFWIHYDRVAMYWRLKKLGAGVSMWRYLFALGVSLRKKPLPRLLATLYGLAVKD